MGVKSTVDLTRQQAEDKYVALRLQDRTIERQYRAQAVMMDNTELEDSLEELNDEVRGGEGFENYCITKSYD